MHAPEIQRQTPQVPENAPRITTRVTLGRGHCGSLQASQATPPDAPNDVNVLHDGEIVSVPAEVVIECSSYEQSLVAIGERKHCTAQSHKHLEAARFQQGAIVAKREIPRHVLAGVSCHELPDDVSPLGVQHRVRVDNKNPFTPGLPYCSGKRRAATEGRLHDAIPAKGYRRASLLDGGCCDKNLDVAVAAGISVA